MKMDKKSKKYAKGGMSSCGTKKMMGGGMASGRSQRRRKDMRDEERRMPMGDKMMPMMKKGGKVRGCGMARQGVRPAKMR